MLLPNLGGTTALDAVENTANTTRDILVFPTSASSQGPKRLGTCGTAQAVRGSLLAHDGTRTKRSSQGSVASLLSVTGWATRWAAKLDREAALTHVRPGYPPRLTPLRDFAAVTYILAVPPKRDRLPMYQPLLRSIHRRSPQYLSHDHSSTQR